MGKQTRTNFGWTVTRRLTNAEILTLFTVPITLIAARANAIFVPLFWSIFADTQAVAYATAANIYLGYTGNLNYWSVSLANSGLDANSVTVNAQVLNATGGIVDPASDIAELPLILSANADPTGGDPANFATVTVQGITVPMV